MATGPGSHYDVAATRSADNVLASGCRAQFVRPSTRRGCRICVTVRLPVRPRAETTHWQANVGVATTAEPRGEKKLFFVQILGGEKLLEFVEKSGEIFLSGLRGAKTFSNAFRIIFSDPFSRFSNRFSYRFKSFSGAVSFCRHAALSKYENPPFRYILRLRCRRRPKGPEAPKTLKLGQKYHYT